MYHIFWYLISCWFSTTCTHSFILLTCSSGMSIEHPSATKITVRAALTWNIEPIVIRDTLQALQTLFCIQAAPTYRTTATGSSHEQCELLGCELSPYLDYCCVVDKLCYYFPATYSFAGTTQYSLRRMQLLYRSIYLSVTVFVSATHC